MPLTIIGVVQNFNFESLHQNIGPLSFRLGGGEGFGVFKVHASNIQQLVTQIQNKWKAVAPGLPFSYRFLNESFHGMYRAEQRVGKIDHILYRLSVFKQSVCGAATGTGFSFAGTQYVQRAGQHPYRYS